MSAAHAYEIQMHLDARPAVPRTRATGRTPSLRERLAGLLPLPRPTLKAA